MSDGHTRAHQLKSGRRFCKCNTGCFGCSHGGTDCIDVMARIEGSFDVSGVGTAKQKVTHWIATRMEQAANISCADISCSTAGGGSVGGGVGRLELGQGFFLNPVSTPLVRDAYCDEINQTSGHARKPVWDPVWVELGEWQAHMDNNNLEYVADLYETTLEEKYNIYAREHECWGCVLGVCVIYNDRCVGTGDLSRVSLKLTDKISSSGHRYMEVHLKNNSTNQQFFYALSLSRRVVTNTTNATSGTSDYLVSLDQALTGELPNATVNATREEVHSAMSSVTTKGVICCTGGYFCGGATMVGAMNAAEWHRNAALKSIEPVIKKALNDVRFQVLEDALAATPTATPTATPAPAPGDNGSGGDGDGDGDDKDSELEQK